PADVGNHDLLEKYVTSDSMTPIDRPATTTIPNDVKRAKSAAARAGTIANAIVVGSSCVIGATRMPSAPASTNAETLFTSESSLGGRPTSIALLSSSAAARVAR